MCRGEQVSHCTQYYLDGSAGQDAVLAAEAGVDGILLSNHGGESTYTNRVVLPS